MLLLFYQYAVSYLWLCPGCALPFSACFKCASDFFSIFTHAISVARKKKKNRKLAFPNFPPAFIFTIRRLNIGKRSHYSAFCTLNWTYKAWFALVCKTLGKTANKQPLPSTYSQNTSTSLFFTLSATCRHLLHTYGTNCFPCKARLRRNYHDTRQLHPHRAQ